VEVHEAFVAVETKGDWTYGETVTDFLGAFGKPFNNLAATKLDADRFWDLVVDGIVRISEQARSAGDRPDLEGATASGRETA
jgi:purine nucleosidase